METFAWLKGMWSSKVFQVFNLIQDLIVIKIAFNSILINLLLGNSFYYFFIYKLNELCNLILFSRSRCLCFFFSLIALDISEALWLKTTVLECKNQRHLFVLCLLWNCWLSKQSVTSCSVAIMLYLTEKFHTPDHWYPADLQKRARVNEYLSWQHSTIRPHGSKMMWFKVSEVNLFSFKCTVSVVNRTAFRFQQLPSSWFPPVVLWPWDWSLVFRIATQLTATFF